MSLHGFHHTYQCKMRTEVSQTKPLHAWSTFHCPTLCIRKCILCLSWHSYPGPRGMMWSRRTSKWWMCFTTWNPYAKGSSPVTFFFPVELGLLMISISFYIHNCLYSPMWAEQLKEFPKNFSRKKEKNCLWKSCFWGRGKESESKLPPAFGKCGSQRGIFSR